MAIKSGGRQRRKELGHGDDSSGGSDVDTRLSVLSLDPQGSKWCTSLRGDGLNSALATPMRDAEGGSATSGEREDSYETVLRDRGRLRSGGKRDGGNNNRGEEEGLPSLESFELAELPDVPNGYRESFEETTTAVAVDGVRHGDDFLDQNAGEFNNIVGKAINKAHEILSMPLPHPSDDNFGKLLQAQQSLSVAVINSGLKADENRFRKKNSLALQSLWDEMERNRHIKIIDN